MNPEQITNDTSQERVDETAKQRHEPCGLECDCTDVCKQDNYKALWEQMCERCDELDKQLAQQAEPVAWLCMTEEYSKIVRFEFETFGNVTPLYTSSPPRQPLTDEEIKVLQDDNWKPAEDGGKDWNTFDFARAIEAAHGIKGQA